MLPLGLFRRRNFAVGNLETFSMYAGLSMLFFFLVLYLQQVAGYSGLEAGMASVPVTIVMFVLSSRFGALADRIGPRLLLGAGPLVAACGFALLVRLDSEVDYVTDLLPALLLFALGLSMTVAPLTSTVLAERGRAERRNRLGSEQRDRPGCRAYRGGGDRGDRGRALLRVDRRQPGRSQR